MTDLTQFLLSLGGILFLGLLASELSERTFLPRATLLLLLGIAIGDEGVQLLPSIFTTNFDTISNMTLMMVGFLVGGRLHSSTIKSAKVITFISVIEAAFTMALVSVGLILFGFDMPLSLLLGAIAAASAPAAIVDVISESKENNKFTNVLVSIVALDDIWALLLFALAISWVSIMLMSSPDSVVILVALLDIVGAIIIGVLIGIPAAYLTGRVRQGEPMMLEAVGVVSLCGGLALWFEVSYLIACMVMGIVIVNLAKHHEYPFHAIEDLESLFLIVFFISAGASLEVTTLKTVGYFGVAYIVLRSMGKYFGTWLGAKIGGADAIVRQWLRYALLPQAGVSIGMALVAGSYFPQYQQVLLNLVVGSTIFFEVIGPIFTRFAIKRASQELLR